MLLLARYARSAAIISPSLMMDQNQNAEGLGLWKTTIFFSKSRKWSSLGMLLLSMYFMNLSRVRFNSVYCSLCCSFIIVVFILLPEKFLPFDWLRAEVFQLNLKYLQLNTNYSYYGNPKSPNNLVAPLTQKWWRFLDFEIWRFKN